MMKTNTSPLEDFIRVDAETAYTACRLIDAVGWSASEKWDWNWLEKRQENYQAPVEKGLAEKAWEILQTKDWLSLQTTSDDHKKITTLGPLQKLTHLELLVLQNNQIEDLSPLSGMNRLSYLNCLQNKLSDLTVLEKLPSLEVLILQFNPTQNLQVLEKIPRLKKLNLSTDQVTGFCNCTRLVKLRELRIDESSDTSMIESLEEFPEMPELNVLKIAGLKDLSGIQRFSKLTTLDLWGSFSDLSGLQTLQKITHVTLHSSSQISFKPLEKLYALRSVNVYAPNILDLDTLSPLPVLHEVKLDDEAKFDKQAHKTLGAGLTPWKAEFELETKRAEPSLKIKIVQEDQFDFFDSKAGYGINDGEIEDGMFKSERAWLIGEMAAAMAARLKEDEDFVLPRNSGLRRSEQLAIYSLKAFEDIRTIMIDLQEILCKCRNDWIIYFQSLLDEGPDMAELPEDFEDFTVWIYPDKIVTTKENAAIIGKLIDWK